MPIGVSLKSSFGDSGIVYYVAYAWYGGEAYLSPKSIISNSDNSLISSWSMNAIQ